MALGKVRALHPDFFSDDCAVVYDGPLPARPRDYYELAAISARHAYVYLLLDKECRFLYVGRARQPGNRFDKHRRKKDWWPDVAHLILLGVTGVDIDDTHALVSALEDRAIRELNPEHNVVGRDR